MDTMGFRAPAWAARRLALRPEVQEREREKVKSEVKREVKRKRQGKRQRGAERDRDEASGEEREVGGRERTVMAEVGNQSTGFRQHHWVTPQSNDSAHKSCHQVAAISTLVTQQQLVHIACTLGCVRATQHTHTQEA